ncbi:MAG TPA: type II toxin-antitoxin system VapC family toxin [Caulobacteraceae bacterium]|nr:type II toxin-antitoxin system VapC family toxin [Caulobacteraceae bacterium]
MFLLDTNVVSELRNPRRADRNVLQWADSTPASRFYLSAVSLMELEHGILLMERKDQAQGSMLCDWFNDQVLLRFEGRVLPFDTAAARTCARLHVPDRRSDRDAMIAATALVHGMTVATRNTNDFAATGVALVNPWAVRIPG